MYEDLQWVCVALFTVSIPLLVVARFRYPEFPAWLLVVAAIALGWCLANAHVTLDHLWVNAQRLEEAEALEEAMRHPSSCVETLGGGCTIENPGIGEYMWVRYRPIAGLAYGLVYLLGCWLAGWLLLRRCASQRRRLGLVAVGVLVAMWIVLIGYRISPPGIFESGHFVNEWNPFFGPQLSLPLALIAAWLLVAWLPTALRHHSP